MTKHDEHLIENANHLFCTDWYLVDKMVDKADAEDAKEKLQTIARKLYHKEEHFAGIL